MQKMISSLEKANLFNKISFLFKSCNEQNFEQQIQKIKTLVEKENFVFSQKHILGVYHHCVEHKKDYLYPFLNEIFSEEKENIFMYLAENNIYNFDKNILNLNSEQLLNILNQTKNLTYSVFYELLNMSDKEQLSSMLKFLNKDLKKLNLKEPQHFNTAHLMVKKQLYDFFDLIDNPALLTQSEEVNGYTPAHYLAGTDIENYKKLSLLYKKHNLNLLDLNDKFNKNCFINVIRQNNLPIIEQAIEDFGATNFFNKTKEALHTSIYKGNQDMSLFFIEQGASLIQSGYLNLDPFWLSIRFYQKNHKVYENIFSKLTPKDIEELNNLNEENTKQRTYVQLAAQYLPPSEIRKLINFGFQVNKKNVNNKVLLTKNEENSDPFEKTSTVKDPIADLDFLLTEDANTHFSIYKNIFLSNKDKALEKFDYFYHIEKIPLKRLTSINFEQNSIYKKNPFNYQNIVDDFFIACVAKFFSKTQNEQMFSFFKKNNIVLTEEENIYLLLHSIKQNNPSLFKSILNNIDKEKMIFSLNNILNHYSIEDKKNSIFFIEKENFLNILKIYPKEYFLKILLENKKFKEINSAIFSHLIFENLEQILNEPDFVEQLQNVDLLNDFNELEEKKILQTIISLDKEKFLKFYQNFKNQYFFQKILKEKVVFDKLLQYQSIDNKESKKSNIFSVLEKYRFVNLKDYDQYEKFKTDLIFCVQNMKNEDFIKSFLTNYESFNADAVFELMITSLNLIEKMNIEDLAKKDLKKQIITPEFFDYIFKWNKEKRQAFYKILEKEEQPSLLFSEYLKIKNLNNFNRFNKYLNKNNIQIFKELSFLNDKKNENLQNILAKSFSLNYELASHYDIDKKLIKNNLLSILPFFLQNKNELIQDKKENLDKIFGTDMFEDLKKTFLTYIKNPYTSIPYTRIYDCVFHNKSIFNPDILNEENYLGHILYFSFSLKSFKVNNTTSLELDNAEDKKITNVQKTLDNHFFEHFKKIYHSIEDKDLFLKNLQKNNINQNIIILVEQDILKNQIYTNKKNTNQKFKI